MREFAVPIIIGVIGFGIIFVGAWIVYALAHIDEVLREIRDALQKSPRAACFGAPYQWPTSKRRLSPLTRDFGTKSSIASDYTSSASHYH